jgi:hypothetical protein
MARLGRADRSPGRSAYWGTPAERRRAREVVGVAESDPDRTSIKKRRNRDGPTLP